MGVKSENLVDRLGRIIAVENATDQKEWWAREKMAKSLENQKKFVLLHSQISTVW